MKINKCYYCMADIPAQETTCPCCGRQVNEETQPEYALPCGSILRGKYLIGAVLGQGGFGITYIGYDLLLNFKVAIKEYFPTGMAIRGTTGSVMWSKNGIPKDEGCANFLKEARKMAKLMDIPEVVRVMDMFMENDTAYIVMEFVEGITLKAKLRQDGVMTCDEAIDLLRPVIRALGEAHQHGIIHRDISPDNIMLDPTGKAHLLDLGAAKEVDMRSESDKQSSQLIHKDGFSPPEQYSTGEEIGAWTDVYAMCATIYYTVTGRLVPPATERALRRKPLEFSDNIPEWLQVVLNKGLTIEPEQRYPTMDTLLQALQSKKAPKMVSVARSKVWKVAIGIAAATAVLAGVVLFVNKSTPEKASVTASSESAAVVTADSGAASRAGTKAELEAVTPAPSQTPAATSAPTPTPESSQTSNKFALANVGDYVTFGTYEQDNDTSNGTEDIEWLVLDKTDDAVLIISRYGLDVQTYNTKNTSTTWETCTLRSWLNSNFYSTAFSEAEQARIFTATVTADDNAIYGTDAGNNAQDKVFLLSIDEATKYFTGDEARQCKPTEYAVAKGAWNNTSEKYSGLCWWWLRSPGSYGNRVACVHASGSIYSAGDCVDSLNTTIRPAMWVTVSDSVVAPSPTPSTGQATGSNTGTNPSSGSAPANQITTDTGATPTSSPDSGNPTDSSADSGECPDLPDENPTSQEMPDDIVEPGEDTGNANSVNHLGTESAIVSDDDEES